MPHMHGSRERFALGFDLIEDPDHASPLALRTSWAKFQIWVGGRNLTAGVSASGAYLTEAACPALPIVKWLLDNWDPLLHQERLPRPAHAASSAAWYVASLKEVPSKSDDLDTLLDIRRAWWKNHGLGAALPDFRIPDVHFRRFAESIEISWDDHDWRTVPGGINLVEPPGAAYLPVEEVVEVLLGWCRDVLDCVLDVLAHGTTSTQSEISQAKGDIADLQMKLSQLNSVGRQEKRLRLAAGVDIERAARRIRSIAGIDNIDIKDTVRSLLGMKHSPSGGFFARLSLPVLLYRSASPQLSESDLENLIGLCNTSELITAPVKHFRDPAPCSPSPEDTTQDGYDLAIEFRSTLGIPENEPLKGPFDIEKCILQQLGIRIRDIRLTDEGVEGVAIFREGFEPIVAVNLSGRFARSPWGRRMTLAHELCHLLRDGEEAGAVGIVSNHWAPYLLERRANAFAAMFLAPEAALDAVLDRDTGRWTRADLKHAMKHLGIGVTTLTRQLYNLRWISGIERDAWVDELTAFD